MKRILIVENHPIMSIGLCGTIVQYLPDAVFAEADTFWKALQAASGEHYDLVIMDVAMLGANLVVMIEKFRTLHPHLPLLMFSNYRENTYVLPCMKAGANGFVSKDAPETEFWLAVETILIDEGTYLTSNAVEPSTNQYLPQVNRQNFFEDFD